MGITQKTPVGPIEHKDGLAVVKIDTFSSQMIKSLAQRIRCTPFDALRSFMADHSELAVHEKPAPHLHQARVV